MYAGGTYAGAPYAGRAAALHDVLDFLQSEPESADAVIEMLETKGAELEAKGDRAGQALRALADWTRRHQDALITALIPTLAAVVLYLLDNTAAEQFDRILEHHEQHHHHDGGSSEQVVEPEHRPDQPDHSDDRQDNRESPGDSAVSPNHQSTARENENRPPADERGRRSPSD